MRDNADSGAEGLCCRRCGAPVVVGVRVPTSCKSCGASFSVRPRWSVSATFLLAVILAMLVAVLVRQLIDLPALLLCVVLLVSLVLFSVLQALAFRMGIIRLANVNADDSLHVSLAPGDPEALRKAEDMVRDSNYAGSSRRMRAAQARQLRDSVQLAKSLREGGKPAGAKDGNAPRCKLRRLSDADESYFVLPATGDVQGEGRTPDDVSEPQPIGFVSMRRSDAHTMTLETFSLVEEERGKGYARSMMRIVTRRARELGCDRVAVRLERDNYQAILAFEHLGFARVGERDGGIMYERSL